ncbi:CorA family divalent cation transporter [Paludibacterium denitrificans]|uniref:CorA family divalent cation transporter n=1 Tax=Paludibacterium denitrificans TaxID=2675226 RepID=UPI0024781B19|nr:CorA family divalent cation transporter [Paludibacterium denitrificans]
MRHAALKQQVPTLGEAPGTLLPVGEVKQDGSSITLIEYGAERLLETRFDTVEAGLAYQPSEPVLWLNVYGLRDPRFMQAIGERFHLHPLVLEDILNARQRPKIEDYGDYLFIATRVFHFPARGGRLKYDQVYLVVGRSFVLTFQERPTGLFEAVRERLRSGRGQIRHKQADYRPTP